MVRLRLGGEMIKFTIVSIHARVMVRPLDAEAVGRVIPVSIHARVMVRRVC